MIMEHNQVNAARSGTRGHREWFDFAGVDITRRWRRPCNAV